MLLYGTLIKGMIWKYLRISTNMRLRIRHAYYGTLIGNHVQLVTLGYLTFKGHFLSEANISRNAVYMHILTRKALSGAHTSAETQKFKI